MGAMTPPSRKSLGNFRVIEINRVLDGEIDVTIDLGFDLYKREILEFYWTLFRKNPHSPRGANGLRR